MLPFLINPHKVHSFCLPSALYVLFSLALYNWWKINYRAQWLYEWQEPADQLTLNGATQTSALVNVAAISVSIHVPICFGLDGCADTKRNRLISRISAVRSAPLGQDGALAFQVCLEFLSGQQEVLEMSCHRIHSCQLSPPRQVIFFPIGLKQWCLAAVCEVFIFFLFPHVLARTCVCMYACSDSTHCYWAMLFCRGLPKF